MSSDLFSKYKPSQTLCFTGHRPERLPQGVGELLRMQSRLTDEIEAAIERGKVSFVSGAMSGFDTMAAERVIRLKKRYPQIQCILIAPFAVRFFNHQNWTPDWETRLRAVIKQADFSISLSEHAYKGVYYDRNRVMVDMSSEVIAYYDGGTGGTKYTVDYARDQNRPIFNVADYKNQTFLPDHVAIGAPLLASMDDPYEAFTYCKIRHEIESDPHIQWSKNIHALIISDRCGWRAIGLYEYLTARTNLTSVRIADNPETIRKAIKTCQPHIVIFVGYQKDKANYQMIPALQKKAQMVVAMFASVDTVIELECKRFGIPLMYDCLESLADFVNMLRIHLQV